MSKLSKEELASLNEAAADYRRYCFMTLAFARMLRGANKRQSRLLKVAKKG